MYQAIIKKQAHIYYSDGGELPHIPEKMEEPH